MVGQRKHFSLYKYTYCTLSKQTRFNDLQNKHVSIRKEKNLNALHIWGSKTTKFPIRIEQGLSKLKRLRCSCMSTNSQLRS